MGYSAWLEFARYSKRKGITSGFTGTLPHHERSFRFLAQHLQRYFPGTVKDCNDITNHVTHRENVDQLPTYNIQKY